MQLAYNHVPAQLLHLLRRRPLGAQLVLRGHALRLNQHGMLELHNQPGDQPNSQPVTSRLRSAGETSQLRSAAGYQPTSLAATKALLLGGNQGAS